MVLLLFVSSTSKNNISGGDRKLKIIKLIKNLQRKVEFFRKDLNKLKTLEEEK